MNENVMSESNFGLPSPSELVWVVMNKNMPHLPCIDTDGAINVFTDKSEADCFVDGSIDLYLKQMNWAEYNGIFKNKLLLWGCNKTKINANSKQTKMSWKEDQPCFNGCEVNLRCIQCLQIERSAGLDKSKENVKASFSIFNQLLKQALNNTVFYVPVKYASDSDLDNTIHLVDGAADLIDSVIDTSNEDELILKYKDGNLFTLPFSNGYSISSNIGGIMNALTIFNNLHNSTFIPIFTSLIELREMFKNENVALATLSDIIKLKDDNINGIILNPFSFNYILPDDVISDETSYSGDNTSINNQKNSEAVADQDTIWVLMNSTLPHLPYINSEGRVTIFNSIDKANEKINSVSEFNLKEMTWNDYYDKFVPMQLLLGCFETDLNQGGRIFQIEPSIKSNACMLSHYILKYIQIENSAKIDKDYELDENRIASIKKCIMEELNKNVFFVPMKYSTDSDNDEIVDGTVHFFSDAHKMTETLIVSESKDLIIKYKNQESYFLPGAKGYISSSESGNVMHIITLKDPDGTSLLPIYTSVNELRQIYKNARVAIASFSDVLNLLSSPVKGVILNPNSFNFVIPQEFLDLFGFNDFNPVNSVDPISNFSGVLVNTDQINGKNSTETVFDIDLTSASELAENSIVNIENQPKNNKVRHKKKNRTKKRKLSKLLKALIIIVSLIVIVFVSVFVFELKSDYKYRNGEKIIWSEVIDTKMLPVPEGDRGYFYYDVTFYACKYDRNKFSDYVKECKAMGYVVDADILNEYDDGYIAYNSEGYKLRIYYDERLKNMDVSLYDPIKLYDMNWPAANDAYNLPDPESNKMYIYNDSYYLFNATVGDITYDEFICYAEKCYNSGYNYENSYKEQLVLKDEPFDIDSIYSLTYRLYNENGYKLNIEYIGYNMIEIKIEDHS